MLRMQWLVATLLIRITYHYHTYHVLVIIGRYYPLL